MNIQRYLRKGEKTIDFGEYFIVNRWDFDWYMGENKIGISSNPSTEAEHFMQGFFVRDDELIIRPSEFPCISRTSDKFATMRGKSSGIREINNLIELIQRQETTHAFIASKDGGYTGICTFSPIEPPSELYELGKVMPVKIRE